MSSTFGDAINSLIFPWLFMFASAQHIPRTIRTLVSQRDWATLLNPVSFQDALFGNFWEVAGPQVKDSAQVRVVPLLEGRVSNGTVRDDVVNVPISGRIIEVGAGSGMWADVFARVAKASAGSNVDGNVRRRTPPITKIYGIEPNVQSSEALRRRVADEPALRGVYEVIPLGIESLSDPTAWGGVTLEPESIDCIVTVLCLCSIPGQKDNIAALYKLLKPGGKWYVYEHVKADDRGLPLRIYQRFVNVFWSFFIGSCRLCKPTEANLMSAGPWSEVDLVHPPDEPMYKVLPHIFGILTK